MTTQKKAKAKVLPAKRKRLTTQERIELGAQDFNDFKAEVKSRPNFEARMQQAQEEIELWEQITLIRERAGLTQTELAQSLGISQAVISRLEKSGHEGYIIATLRKLAQAIHHLIIRFEPDNRGPIRGDTLIREAAP